MRPRISKSNVRYFIRQRYGFKNVEQFFEFAQQQPKLKENILRDIVRQFTEYKLDVSVNNGNLITYNPYTNKYEGLNIKNFDHVTDSKGLFKELSMLHKTRMRMLEQSRKRILELSKKKKKTRDHDLETSPKKSNERLTQLSSISEAKKQDMNIER